MSSNALATDPGLIIRRSLFFLVLILLSLGNIFAFFQGLNAPHAMDQAQIAREISRGNGFTTKMIRPVAYYQAEQAHGNPVPFAGFEDTFHAPLNPLINAAVFKIVGADSTDAWQLGSKEVVFPLDRVVATVCTLFFLMAIGVNYFLVSRIFDAKIAGVCAILMLFCDTFWEFSLSGLPQMLMLFLFSSALYFVYRAVEAATEDRSAFVPAVMAGVFFTLLALTHWITLWIVLGYLIFAALVFRPRGMVAGVVLALLLVAAAFPMMRAINHSGSLFGTAFLTLYNGLSSQGDAVMRTHDLGANPLSLDGLISNALTTSLLQLRDIIPFLGGIVIAPLFFLSLLHPFKRPSIAIFRWAILLMFVFAAIGLSFFGVSPRGLDPNQIHLLFAPVMTAYGLAFVSILWSRLPIIAQIPMLKNAHFVLIILICATPLILSLPLKVRIGMATKDMGGVPHWPPYYAPALNLALKNWVDENQVVVSDQPWAVAWYSDRMSVWLPPSREGFEKLENLASDFQTPFSGILISPSSHGSSSVRQVVNNYNDFAPLILDGPIFSATRSPGLAIYEKAPQIQSLIRRYSTRSALIPMDLVYYSDRQYRNPGSSQ